MPVFDDKKDAALTLDNAPVGTVAPAVMGGHWYRTEHGWKWNGPDGSGSTFERPGGDWTGRLYVGENSIPEEIENVSL